MKKFLTAAASCIFFSSILGEEISFINSNNARHTKEAVYCSGDVIIVYYRRIISADEISYDKKNELIEAKGNVIIKDEKLNTYFADSLSVKKNFASGKAKNVKIIMPDKSRLAAEECTLRDGKFELENAIFTPCYECTDCEELTWQIKSPLVTFDPEEYTEYENVKFELLGSPIFYMPYLSHVSPKIKRKSGFLVPELSVSSKRGFGLCPKYLCSISDSQELLLKPIVTSKIGSVGWIYYGLRFPNGEFNIDASMTGTKSVSNKVGGDDFEEKAIRKIKDSGYRGHVFSKIRYEINDIWRCSSDINLASDRYYLKRFPFFPSIDRVMESNAKLEGFDDENYTSLKMAMFQSEYLENVPRILPALERNYSHELMGGTFHWDSVFMNLDFNNNRSAQKMISKASWDKKILLPQGNIFNIKGVAFFRGLNVSERQKTDYGSSFNAVPLLHCSWQWPLVLSSNWMSTIVTPVAGTIISVNKKYYDVFEDPVCEANILNLFDENRSVSPYNIDPGKRIYYGLKLAGYSGGENLYRFMVGRSAELTTPPERLESSGLKHKHSNIITALDVFLLDELTFVSNGSYSTREKKWLTLEGGLRFSNEKIDFEILAFKGKQCLFDPFATNASSLTEEQKIQKYKGVMLDISWHASDSITLKGGIVIGNEFKNATSLHEKPLNRCKLVRHNVRLLWHNECTEIQAMVERRNHNGGDLKPETVFTFVVYLKNLGI
ncbi:MAG: LPS assembly protein LptD [Holosporaceae bacterium]|jgi:LPS-assembly protein|nr:LPS assembly protein LptD [Holosporaceae bacterium]